MNQYKDTTHASQRPHGANSEHLDSKGKVTFADIVNSVLSFLFLVSVLLLVSHCQSATP